MARAKHTNRAEARRRYRKATSQVEGTDDMDLEGGDGPITSSASRSAPRPPSKPGPVMPARPSFMGAFRNAYHTPHVREDLVALPKLLMSRAMLGAVALVLVGAAAQLAFPGYTGSAFAWELLVLPGSALAPQLVAGFFAPRASYLLGLIVGLLQGLVFTVVLTQFAARLGTNLPSDQIGSLLTLSFVTGPVSGLLFSAAAAWYRRFLALSSPRRAAPGGRAKTPAKTTSARRPTGR